MFTDLKKFEQFWNNYFEITNKQGLSGHDFEVWVLKKLSSHFNIIANYEPNKQVCVRGINKHQFDLDFILDDNHYWCECKYTNQSDQSSSWKYIKDGLSKFVFASFQRSEHERKQNLSKSIKLILFTNIALNKSVVNDCFFNNVIFINPYQPYVPLALLQKDKCSEKLSSFLEEDIYNILKNYSINLFNCQNNAHNTINLNPKITEYYFSLLSNYKLEKRL